MTIIGLENNYYLSGNDIWIKVSAFAEPVAVIEVTYKNLTSGTELPAFKMYPSPTNEFIFNICIPVRALLPPPDHINNNSLQNFEIKFKTVFINTNTADTEIILQKYFIRGGRNKNGNDEWYLTPSHELIVGPWVDYGFPLPGFAQRIQGDTIVDFIPNWQFKKYITGCDYKILKFLNSLGGYQYYVFEKYDKKTKSKVEKVIETPTARLRQDRGFNTGIDAVRQIELYTKTPIEMQEIFTDLVISQEVYLYNPIGSDSDAMWERLILDSNESIENNYERVFENKISFGHINHVTKKI